jgi:hypothetical protein
MFHTVKPFLVACLRKYSKTNFDVAAAAAIAAAAIAAVAAASCSAFLIICPEIISNLI